MTLKTKPQRILGQKPTVLQAVWQNVLSWFVRTFAPSLLPRLIAKCEQEDGNYRRNTASPGSDEGVDKTNPTKQQQTRCISIGRPGGVEQLRVITLKPGIVTCGYNVGEGKAFTNPIQSNNDVPSHCIVLRNEAFSVNYADCCIR